MDTGATSISVIVNNTAMNIGVLMFFQISVLGSFRYMGHLHNGILLGFKRKKFYPL